MAAVVATRPNMNEQQHLAGDLTAEGLAKLAPTSSSKSRTLSGTSTPSTDSSAMSDRVKAVPPAADSEDEDADEDYDKQQPDPTAVLEGSRGGSMEAATDATQKAKRPSKPSRRTSIPIRLEKTETKGHYMLRADDPVIKELLKKGVAQSADRPKHADFKDIIFTRRFTTFDRQNPSNNQSLFHGFFTLFWIGMFLLFVRVAANNWRLYGSVVGGNEVAKLMFSKDIIVLGLTDGAMCLSTALGLAFQIVIAKGYIDWDRSGMIIQNIWQAFFMFASIGWTFYREWPWTHTVFIVLHALVFLMKQHSYAFYNGYLSQIYKRKKILDTKLSQLNTISPPSSPTSIQEERLKTPDSANGRSTSSIYVINQPSSRPSHRRKSSTNTNLNAEKSDVASAAAALSSGDTLTPAQVDTFRDVLSAEINNLENELKGKCHVTQNFYPSNLNVKDFAEWTCFPTLVYELEYPRQESINWAYVAEKAGATFGTLAIMQVISQAFIYPLVKETVRMKENGLTLAERWDAFPFVVLDLLFPLLLEQLLTWYVIWECVLNVLAELTRFADRGFYGDWWNSTSWDQYARDWNRPVHNFLLRHVYHSSISTFRLSKMSATFVTFLLSACVHELVMFCLFKKVRGYLFAMQLLQLPLVMLSRTPLLKGKKTLGNIFFWIGLYLGPSFLTAAYLVI